MPEIFQEKIRVNIWPELAFCQLSNTVKVGNSLPGSGKIHGIANSGIRPR